MEDRFKVRAWDTEGGHWESPSIKRASKAYGWDD